MARRALFVGLVLGISATAWGQFNSLNSLFHRPIQAVRIDPIMPRSTEPISVILTGWKTAGFEVHDVDIQIMGSTIYLNIFWNLHGLTDWSLVSYEDVESLGTLSPGTYTLKVQYSGVMVASSSTIFTVLRPISDRPGSSFPWSWFEDLLPD
jgi:hypothetical protein